MRGARRGAGRSEDVDCPGPDELVRRQAEVFAAPQSPAPTPPALRMDLCKHYPGVTAESCRAGQRYEDVAAAADPHWDGYGSEPLNARLPCCIRNEHRDHACGKRRLPTIDEIREGEE